jgi:hypothetical protein
MSNNDGIPNQGQGTPGEVNNDENESVDHGTVSYRWLDEGIAHADGCVYHETVQITSDGRTFQVRKGDAVLLFCDEEDWGAQWPCRVERMWEPVPNSDPRPVLFTARWFWHKGDFQQLPYKWDGSLTRKQLMARMAADEVVLSNHLDENEIATIDGPCSMTYHATSENRIRPGAGRTLLPKSFQCQYKVDIMPGNSSVKLLPLTNEDKRFFNRSLTEDQRQAIQDHRRALGVSNRKVEGKEGKNEDDNYNGDGVAFENEQEEEGIGDDTAERQASIFFPLSDFLMLARLFKTSVGVNDRPLYGQWASMGDSSGMLGASSSASRDGCFRVGTSSVSHATWPTKCSNDSLTSGQRGLIG